MEQLDRYWEAVRRMVCEKCIDGDGTGNCRLTPGQECALQNHLPEVVRTVLSVKSSQVQPYVDALRVGACSVCNQQAPDGTCTLRTQLDCGLDRYFPLVIEAIEAVNLELEKPADQLGSNQ
ncbi:MAG TPA: hypothetical protein VGB89_10945 [Bacteroidota bacterium]|jgi:hypothetical protein